jgi:hypothetical protein
MVIALLVSAAFLVPPALERRADSIGCINQMVAIGMAARMWANDHQSQLPPDLLTMSNEVVSPKILFCPRDRSRRTTDWAIFAADGGSYEVVTPALSTSDTNAIFLRCRVHGHVGFSDGTVFDGKRRASKRGL